METHPDVLDSLQQQQGEDTMFEEDEEESDVTSSSAVTVTITVTHVQLEDRSEEDWGRDDSQSKQYKLHDTPKSVRSDAQQKLTNGILIQEPPVCKNQSTNLKNGRLELDTDHPVNNVDQRPPKELPKKDSSKIGVRSKKNMVICTAKIDPKPRNTNGESRRSKEEDEPRRHYHANHQGSTPVPENPNEMISKFFRLVREVALTKDKYEHHVLLERNENAYLNNLLNRVESYIRMFLDTQQDGTDGTKGMLSRLFRLIRKEALVPTKQKRKKKRQEEQDTITALYNLLSKAESRVVQSLDTHQNDTPPLHWIDIAALRHLFDLMERERSRPSSQETLVGRDEFASTSQDWNDELEEIKVPLKRTWWQIAKLRAAMMY